jgi:putative SOS response-associated peptidase YedK
VTRRGTLTPSLCEQWTDQASGEAIRSCTIITTEPNALCAPIHDRMPVILDRADYVRWLGQRPVTTNELQAMLRPYPANEMEAVKIGLRIGNVRNDGAALVEPVA